MLMNTQAGCPYGSIWYRELAKAGYRFIDNDAYVDVAPNSYISLDDALDSDERILLYWRWRNSGVDKAKADALARQYELLAKVPERCVVLDGDHMLIKSDVELLSMLGVSIVHPELSRPDATMYPYFDSLERRPTHLRGLPLVYVGTPTERKHQMLFYCQDIDVDLYGSWQDLGMPSNFLCHGKLSNNLLLETIAGKVSLALAKLSYYETGYITPRWYECAYAGCALIVPDQYAAFMPDYMLPWVATTSHSTRRLYEMLSNDAAAHHTNVEDLRRFCKEIAGNSEWLNGFASIPLHDVSI